MIKRDRATTTESMAAAVFMAVLLMGSAVWGQAPPDAGRLLEEMQKTMPSQPSVPPKIEIPAPPEPAMRERKEAKLFVKGFTFTIDAPVVSEAELQQVVKEYTNREVSFGELEQAAEKVALYLREKGYFLAKAYVPKQEIREGMVRITVLIGRAEGPVSIEVEKKRLKESAVQKIMDGAIKAGEPVRLGDLERGILLVNDLPGVTASTNLAAGSTLGTTRIGVKTTEGSLLAGNASFDTFGNRFTGMERLTGAINVNNPTGYGDQIILSGMQAGEPVFDTDGGKTYLWKAGWQLPVGYSGLRGGVSYSSLAYWIGKELAATEGNGTARIWAANATYPLVRSRESNLYGNVSYEYRDLFNALGSTTTSDKRVSAVNLGVQGDAMDNLWGGGYTMYGFAATFGSLDLGRSQGDFLLDQQTKGTDGGYAKVNFNTARQQNIGDGFSLYGALSGQIAGNNLDSSEQIILGGPAGVRAYPSGEAAGDEGVLINAELRKDFPGTTAVGRVQAVVFYDYGWIRQHKNTWNNWNGANPGLDNEYGISGAGAGINISKTAKYLVRGFWATKIGSNPGKSAAGFDSDGQSLSNRFWIQGVVYF